MENGGNHENDATALKVYELVEFQLVALEMVYKNKFHFMHCPHVKIYLVSSWRFTKDKYIKSLSSLKMLQSDLKSDNLQYNTTGCWNDCLIGQASDGPSIILIDWK